MAKVARDGLVVRMKFDSYDAIDEEYRDRMEYEIQMMHQMGFATYYLVVWDYIKFARDNNIPVGPGRGSAAGSLVAYSMGITNIDPVHHGLLFERFLNPERKSMPDVDTDFCIEKRGKVIEYVTEKYGKDHVAQIITFNRMTSKAVLKDVARVLDIPYAESDKMAKMIPISRGKPAKLKVMISKDDTPEPAFREKYTSGDYVPGTSVTYQHWTPPLLSKAPTKPLACTPLELLFLLNHWTSWCRFSATTTGTPSPSTTWKMWRLWVC